MTITDNKNQEKKRILFIVIDQLPGHWAKGVNVAEDMPPANIWDYHKKGLIPNFSNLIKNGIFAFSWNRGTCDTPHGMKYLATGSYNVEPFWKLMKNQSFYDRTGLEPMGLFEYAKRHNPEGITAACFTTDNWAAPGYFFTATDTYALSAYFSDENMWRDFALPYLRRRIDWNLVHVYFPINDIISNCPSYSFWMPHARSSKHAYLLFLDSLLGEIVEFLKFNDLWSETYLILASDHGYHAACSAARNIEARIGINSPNWCCDHHPPYDCEIWDFENDRSRGLYSGCPRRTLSIVSGGGLEKSLQGKIIEESEIIDIAPTIADILKIPYKCEGKSLFEKIKH
jgi:hypothetical protein